MFCVQFQINIQQKYQNLESKYFFLLMKIKFKEKHSAFILILFIIILGIFQSQAQSICLRQRCCFSTPCTSNYCAQKNSQTWTGTATLYSQTKLVLSNDQCKPCPYDCRVCSSQTSCTTCGRGFYMDSSISRCMLCSDRCLACTVVNSITKCSSCQDDSFLDSNTLACKSCPAGAKTCSSSTAVIQCQSGYRKSSNSLYCTACPSNCVLCSVSDTVCSSCLTGYYLTSGSCIKCPITNCLTCSRPGSSILCTSCNSGYFLQSNVCNQCLLNCRTCSSSACTACNSGYYLNGGSLCSPVPSLTTNCLTYSSSNACSACSVGYYLKNSTLCSPCSLLCATCKGSHFGRCLTCNSNAALFNEMCLISNFPSTYTYNLFISFPHSFSLVPSGSLKCSNEYVSGTTITLNLNNLKGYKVQLSWKLYSKAGSTTYSVQLANSAGRTTNNFTTSTTEKYYLECDGDLTTYYHISQQLSLTLSSIKKLNTLTFSTSNSVQLFLHQLIITVHKCNELCIQCTQTLCTECLMTKLYTQEAYCVYTCSKNYYIYLDPSNLPNPKQCLQECPLGSYTLTSNISCVACTSPCLTCLSGKFCLSCVDGYYLTKENMCNATCPFKYYGKVQTKTCQKCLGRCLQCLSQEKCLSCKVGFLFNNTQSCIDTCEFGVTAVKGLYADLNTLYCQLCSINCLNCLYNSARCIQCINTKYLYEYQCLSSCPQKYFAPSGSNVCKKCEYPCKNCLTTSTTCTECISGYLYNRTCVNDCPARFYEDNANLLCTACDSKCVECHGSATYCLSCQSGYYYFKYGCYIACPDGYYIRGTTGICIACVNLCKTCLNQTYCLSCKSNFLYLGRCLSSGQCQTGYFADMITLTCQPCSSPCLQCQYSSTYCTRCNITSTLIYLQDHTCVASCSSTFYYSKKNATTATCQLCEEPCLKCLSSTLCLSCISGYKYSNNICSSTCSIGTYFDILLNDCTNCSSNCLLCSSQNFCQSCVSNFYIYSISSVQNQCVSECLSTYYAQSLSSSCQKCFYPCQTCESSIDCLTCLFGAIYEKRCIFSCPDSTYLNIASNICVSCSGNCLTCSDDPNYCLSCKDTFYLYYFNHTCIISCPSKYYPQNFTKSCLQCPSTCQTCINSTYCLTCIQEKSYKSTQINICVQNCPSGYYGNKQTTNCLECSAKCLTCRNSADNCLSCVMGYLFIKISFLINDCKLSCPPGYYSQASYCYSCSFPCFTCLSSSKCLTCIQGTYYHKDSLSCLLNCPTETFYDYDQLTCNSCEYPCESCDSSSTFCLSCSDLNGVLYLYNGQCIASCLSGYYADESGICNKCYGLCSTCSDKYQCLTCLAGYVYDSFCYSSCPLGTYANTTTSTCQTCSFVCSQCVLQSTYCTKCSGGLFVYKGNCSSSCPTGTYEDNGQCKICTFPCVSCTTVNNCGECLGGYLLYMNISCINDVAFCPNDFYKMDSKYCVPVTWCPSNYFVDQTLKTCSFSCDRKKYTNLATKKCQSSCLQGWYAGVDLICQKWATNPPVSLMAMSAITFIQSSYFYIQIIFNQTIQWNDIQTNMYTLSLVQSRLLFTQYNIPQYALTLQSPKSLKLKPSSYPQRITLNLPAYRLKSSSTSYPLQNPKLTINLHSFTPYSNAEIYSGIIIGQFSEGISWFIILLSFFFLFKNRLSDLYVLWDTVQLLYLMVFLDIQYPPNLNQFFNGLKYTHFTFLPSIFDAPSTRQVSDLPFYAYSYDNSFLRNTGSLFFALVIVFGFYIILKLLQYLIRKVHSIKQKAKQYPGVKSLIYKGVLRYRWHHISDIMFLTYPFIMLFGFAQIRFMQQNPGNTFSNVLAIITCIVYILWVVFVGHKLYKHFKNISKGKMINNLKCFYRGIQKENKFGIALVLVRYARKLFYSLIISIFSANPMFALPILMFSSVLMCLFLFINMPYKKRLSNMITLASEIIIVVMYILVALINFNNQTFDASTKHSFGWTCCILLAAMIFALIYEVFCKTMFYLEPQVSSADMQKDQNKQKMLNDKEKQYLRKKAEEFFDSLLPRLREKLNFDDDSDDELYKNYEEGDSKDSQNNQQRQKDWNDQNSHNSDQFKHYDNSSHSQGPTAMNSKPKIPQAPQYLVRCVKDIE